MLLKLEHYMVKYYVVNVCLVKYWRDRDVLGTTSGRVISVELSDPAIGSRPGSYFACISVQRDPMMEILEPYF